MTARVVYYSRKRNTRRLAEAIARGAKVAAEDIDRAYVTEPVDVLFVGASLYGGQIVPVVTQFLEELDRSLVKKVVAFGTSATGKSTRTAIGMALEENGVVLSPKDFFCKGSFLVMNRGKPDADDLAAAEKFAAGIVK